MMPFILADRIEAQKKQIPNYGSWEKDVLPENRDEHYPWEFISDGYGRYYDYGQKHELTAEDIEGLPKVLSFGMIPKTGMPDFFGVGEGMVVSQRVKDKLEELEPGGHDFVQIKVIDTKRKTERDDFYLVYLWQMPDIIDHDNTYYSRGNHRGPQNAKAQGQRYLPNNYELDKNGKEKNSFFS